MDQFSALADETRRKIVELLARSGEMAASEIYDHFEISAPAVSQHLRVLREAELVVVEKRAQQRIYRLNPQAMRDVEQWTRRWREMWEQRFDALALLIEEEKRKERQNG